jgi:hypothetical protein
LYLPPVGHCGNSFGQVLRADHKSRAIENHPVHDGLSSEPAEAISIGLYLVPVDRAVYDSDVDTNLPAAKTQLLQKSDARLLAVSLAKTSQ